jgi:hypothetical protein
MINKPILIIGDCSQEWIDDNNENIYNHISNVALGCICHGINTHSFSIPIKNTGNIYLYANWN